MTNLKKLAACFVVLVGMSTISACVIDREHYHDRDHREDRGNDHRGRYHHHDRDRDGDHDHDHDYR